MVRSPPPCPPSHGEGGIQSRPRGLSEGTDAFGYRLMHLTPRLRNRAPLRGATPAATSRVHGHPAHIHARGHRMPDVAPRWGRPPPRDAPPRDAGGGGQGQGMHPGGVLYFVAEGLAHRGIAEASDALGKADAKKHPLPWGAFVPTSANELARFAECSLNVREQGGRGVGTPPPRDAHRGKRAGAHTPPN